MGGYLTVLLLLSLLVGPNYGVKVTQVQKLLIIKSGEAAELYCEHDDSSYYNMFWYQQKPDQGLKLMLHSLNVGSEDLESDYKDNWGTERKFVLNSTLILKKGNVEDSATYFCATSHRDAQYFGEGTLLHVMEKGQEEKNVANVAIFRPNPKEQTDHGYLSIVCLASGFFPEHVQLQWKVNKKERDGSQGKAIKTGDTYSISSRLSLTKNEYYNPDNTFECSAGLRGRTDVKTESIRGEKSCGVSPDELKRIVNNGVYSYILILCKTALYGLIVTAIVLRKKAIANAY
uniref:Ig-like domain-containing protein n=1 Tax=Xenopus laevis TaxID=8355 RepID=B7ZSI5_XENLA|nr:Unknown (protein for MGC:197262) [Xenopus laevis]